MKTYILASTVAVASLLLASPSQACEYGEVCEGLTLEINDNRVVNIEGIGGIDLSGVKIKSNEHVDVNLPNPVDNAIEVSQTNTGHIYANVDYKGDFISGDFESSVSAIANNIAIGLEGTNAIEGGQDNNRDVIALSDIEMNHLVAIDSITASVTAVSNNATFEGTGDSIVDFAQENTGYEVTALLDASFQGQRALGDADVDINVSAISNNLSILGDGAVVASLAQHNCADITASANVSINAMRDPLNVTAVANNINISRINQ